MALLVSDIVADAIGMAYPYVSEPNVAYNALLRGLTTLDREVIAFHGITVPERVSTSQTITVVLATNPTGYPLFSTNVLGYRNFKWIDTSGYVWPIKIVPETRFDHPGQHPAGVVRGYTFFPSDPEEIRWSQGGLQREFYQGIGDTITYDYLPDAPRITTLTQNLVSPDETRQFFVTNLAVQVLLSAGVAVPETVMQMAVQRGERERNLMQLMASKRNEVRSQTGDPAQ